MLNWPNYARTSNENGKRAGPWKMRTTASAHG